MSSKLRPNKKPYVSCIKIDGVPILPPLITNEERELLLKYKSEAIAIENKLKFSRKNNPLNHFCQKAKENVEVAKQSISCKTKEHCQASNKSSTQIDLNGNRKKLRKNESSPCGSPKCHKIKKQLKSMPVQNETSNEVSSENINNVTPRKSIRRNSYTLESPTPEIIEHLCALQHKNDQRLKLESGNSDFHNLSPSALKTEKYKCLKNLNLMKFQSEESYKSSYDSQEKTFLENLPQNFFHANENVLSASRSDLSESKLTNSIQQAAELLNSINLSGTTPRSELTRESNSDGALTNSTVTNTHSILPDEESTMDSASSTSHNLFARAFLPQQSDVRSETCDMSNATITNLVLPHDSDVREQRSESHVPNHRHRRVWNLKQAKHLWENEQLQIPEKKSHSEPSTRRNSPLLSCKQNLSYSLTCLEDLDMSAAPSSHDYLKPVPMSTGDNLQKPDACLERSLTTSTEEDLNLYSYYLNLYKDMSAYVSQQGELLSPTPRSDNIDSQKTIDFFPEETLNTVSQGIYRGASDDDTSYGVSRQAFPCEGTSVVSNTASSSMDQVPRDLIQFDPDEEDFDLEIPDNLDDIEQFLRDLQRSQEQEMAFLLRKQQEEQLWLKQKQQRLKESVLSVSSRSSSQQSSLNCSEMSSVCDVTSHAAQHYPLSLKHDRRDSKEADSQHEEYSPVISKAQYQNPMDRVTNENDLNLANVSAAVREIKSNEITEASAVSDVNVRVKMVPNKSIDSNKSTPSQHYDSCEEWFTPEADKLSPMSDDMRRIRNDSEEDRELQSNQTITEEPRRDKPSVLPMSQAKLTNNAYHDSNQRHGTYKPVSEGVLCKSPIPQYNPPTSQYNPMQWRHTSVETNTPLDEIPRTYGEWNTHELGYMQTVSNNKEGNDMLGNLGAENEHRSRASHNDDMLGHLGAENEHRSRASHNDDMLGHLGAENEHRSRASHNDDMLGHLGAENEHRSRASHNDDMLGHLGAENEHRAPHKVHHRGDRTVGVLKDILNMTQHSEDVDQTQGRRAWQANQIDQTKPNLDQSNRGLPSLLPSVDQSNRGLPCLLPSLDQSNRGLPALPHGKVTRDMDQIETSVTPFSEDYEKTVSVDMDKDHEVLKTVSEDKPPDQIRLALLWQQWMDEVRASKMAETNPNQLDTLSQTSNHQLDTLSQSVSQASELDVPSGAFEFSPQTQAKLVDILGKDWSDIVTQETRNREVKLSEVTSQQPDGSSLSSSMTELTDYVPRELIQSSNVLKSRLNPVQAISESMTPVQALSDYVQAMSLGEHANQPPVDVSIPQNTLNSNNATSESPSSDIPDPNHAETSPNSSAPMSLESVKQKYLLTPNVKRTPGLHEFETNVVSRLHREANLRPKTIIKASYSEREQAAALTLTAAARGFLVRRLLRSQRVQHIKATIQDTLQCAMSLQSDPASLSSMDLDLHTRLIQQLTAACYELYDTFFSLSTREKLAIISQDRERLRNLKLAALLKEKRPSLPSIPALTRTRRSQKTMSEPKSNNATGAVKAEKKTRSCVSKVRRSRSVSSQDIPSSRSTDSSVSSMSGYRVSRSQSTTLDNKPHQVPPIRRRLLLI
ncbi:hypothetical protein M8J76_001359 [Diaphorina citri]|nr:hypothetical protein M8J76_001359 [Diaphorina citri]